MPGFSVRRKKKVLKEPTPEPEAVEEDTEMADEDSYDEEEDRYIDEVMKEAETQREAPKPVTRPQYQPQRRVQFQQPARVAQERPNVVHQYAQQRPRYPITDPYRRKPTMDVPPKAHNTSRGRARMRYGTHYGMTGGVLGTQDKARMLYTHCFG